MWFSGGVPANHAADSGFNPQPEMEPKDQIVTIFPVALIKYPEKSTISEKALSSSYSSWGQCHCGPALKSRT